MDKHPLRVATEARDLGAMVETLAEDVVFRSPVISSPVHGRGEVREIFEIVLEHFHDLEYTDELSGEGRRALFFSARVRGRPVELVQVLSLDGEGKIRELRLMARPLAGLAAIAAVVGRGLARRRGGGMKSVGVNSMAGPLLALTAAVDAGAPGLVQERS
jgi:hypothetical protein